MEIEVPLTLTDPSRNPAACCARPVTSTRCVVFGASVNDVGEIVKKFPDDVESVTSADAPPTFVSANTSDAPPCPTACTMPRGENETPMRAGVVPPTVTVALAVAVPPGPEAVRL